MDGQKVGFLRQLDLEKFMDEVGQMRLFQFQSKVQM